MRLLEQTALRVGNEEYAKVNRSFGLSTLRNRHASVTRGSIRFRFRAKGGKPVEVDVDDRRLAAVVRRCQELPGQALFEYLEPDPTGGREPHPEPIDSDDVNGYLREALGGEFSAKDLRTWAGTMQAFRALRATAQSDGREAAEPDRSPRQVVVDAIRETAATLGNTPTVARSSYIHPGVVAAFLEDGEVASDPVRRGRPEELALLRLLRRRKAASERTTRARKT